MSDDRPRPAYGEYATPEEQRARIQQPDLTFALEAGQDPGQVAGAADHPRTAAEPGGMGGGLRSTTAAPARLRVDRIVAFVLLGYGLVQVAFTVGQLVDFASFATQFMSVAGIDGEFTNFAQGRLWGAIAAVSYAVGWGCTALVVVLRVRRGKRVWWVPLVGAAITFVVLTVLLTIPLMGDPAIAAHLATLS